MNSDASLDQHVGIHALRIPTAIGMSASLTHCVIHSGVLGGYHVCTGFWTGSVLFDKLLALVDTTEVPVHVVSTGGECMIGCS